MSPLKNRRKTIRAKYEGPAYAAMFEIKCIVLISEALHFNDNSLKTSFFLKQLTTELDCHYGKS